MLLLALSITAIVLSRDDNKCNEKDQMGLDISHYLLGSGIMGLVLFVIWVSIKKSGEIPCTGIIAGIFWLIFGISWFFVGAIILFRSNLDCIKEEGTIVVYAVVVWCISFGQIIRIFKACQSSSQSNQAIITESTHSIIQAKIQPLQANNSTSNIDTTNNSTSNIDTTNNSTSNIDTTNNSTSTIDTTNNSSASMV
jgi:hypothetical protein